MANDTIQCPVCGEVMQSYMSFCPACSFEIHLLPDDVPPTIKEMEEQRVRYAKNSLLSKKEELARLNRMVGQINEQLERKQEEVSILIQQNQKYKEAIEVSAANSSSASMPCAFLVMMQGDSITALYNINEGENSFGYSGSHERHQQIICDVPIADCHFVVKAASSTDSKGRKRTKFFVAPCDGKIYGATDEANKIDSEIPLEKNGSFFIKNIKFTLVVNKR